MRKLKYRNKIVKVDGLVFHSKGEQQRWEQLKLMQRAGEIENLSRQVEYTLKFTIDGRVFSRKYIADFEYMEKGNLITEDFKSSATMGLDVFKIKADLFYVLYGRHIRITTNKGEVKSARRKPSNTRGLPSKKQNNPASLAV